MKSCPVCRNQYTDPTLRFCLQDGASLVALEEPQSAVETIAFANPVTVEKIQPTAEMNFFAAPPDDQTRNFQDRERNAPLAAKKSGSRLIWLMVLPIFLFCGALGVGGWFYLAKQKNMVASKTIDDPAVPADARKNAPSEIQKSPAEKSEVTDSINLPPTAPDAETIKREITAAVEAWKNAAQDRNAAEYSGRYHETVDYYDKTLKLADVRGEAQKVFSTYKDIDIALTNLRVAADTDGKRATAVFDKEWDYETDKDLIEGKAHVKLQFQKIGSDWKIVGEKNLKVYYTEN